MSTQVENGYRTIISSNYPSKYEDALEWLSSNDGYELAPDLISLVNRAMMDAVHDQDYENADRWRDLLFRIYCFHGKVCFDSYLIALEYDRKPAERFYLPRRKVLKPLVDALQDLTDGKLDELFLSMPPRVGKTTLLMFFTTWCIGRNSESSNLYSSYSDIITSAFYNGINEILTDPITYKWKSIFPDSKIVSTNAKDETLNIDRKKRYPSLTCRSLYGTLNGACDCNGILISDDLIGSIEEALNRDRLVAAWAKVDNNLLPRAKEHAKILWCGTRWSMIDPAGVRMELLLNDKSYKDRRFKIINLPALDENDESNFQYDYDVGFSTDYYRQRRASFERNNDMASWLAQYMGEPIEREGTLFEADGFMYYNGDLPAVEPDRKFLIVDPSFGGGDFLAGVVGYQYGDDVYIPNVIFDNAEKNVTQPKIGERAVRYDVSTIQIEANKSTESYTENIAQYLDGKKITIRTKAAPTTKGKEQRIFDRAPDIRAHFIFLDDGHRTKEYTMFMQNVFSFKITGKNKHDDAPDVLSMAAEFAFRNTDNRVSVFKRPF